MLFPKKRVGFYVDGFNFYHAVAALRRPDLKWMCYRDLAHLLVDRTEAVEYLKIFSAYATHLRPSMLRHRVVVRAWEARGCECIMGEFKRKQVYCKQCRTNTEHFEEKATDVNIAIHLLDDCRTNRCDVAYVMTTDSDIAPAIKLAAQVYPQIEIVTVAPVGRKPCLAIRHAGARRQAIVSLAQIESSIMPREIFARGELVATRPPEIRSAHALTPGAILWRRDRDSNPRRRLYTLPT